MNASRAPWTPNDSNSVAAEAPNEHMCVWYTIDASLGGVEACHEIDLTTVNGVELLLRERGPCWPVKRDVPSNRHDLLDTSDQIGKRIDGHCDGGYAFEERRLHTNAPNRRDW